MSRSALPSRGFRAALGLGLVAGLAAALVAAAPANADGHETVLDIPAGSLTACGGEIREYGQSFSAPATGWITQIGLHPANWREADPPRTFDADLRIIEGAGLTGTTIGGPQTVTWNVQGPDPVLQVVELAVPVPVTAGDVLTWGIKGDCRENVGWGTAASSYAGGAAYLDEFGLVYDLAFRVVVASTLEVDTDADGDGVPDAADVCAGTDLAAEADSPSRGLKPNHVWTTDAGFVDRTGEVIYGLAEAGGCSATQIIVAAGLGTGAIKHGISPKAMAAWLASLD